MNYFTRLFSNCCTDMNARGKSETSFTSNYFLKYEWGRVKYWWSTSEVPVKYEWSTSEVLLKYQWSTNEVEWSTSKAEKARLHWYITDTSLILQWYFTVLHPYFTGTSLILHGISIYFEVDWSIVKYLKYQWSMGEVPVKYREVSVKYRWSTALLK
jgi:hypothetical protein